MSSPVRTPAVVLAAAVLVLAACGGGDGAAGGVADTTTTTTEAFAAGDGGSGGGTTTTTAPATTTTEATTTTSTTTSTTLPPTTTTEPEPEPDPIDPTCLVGRWVVPEEQLTRFYDALAGDGGAAAGGDVQFEVLGQMLLTFGETTYEYLPDFILQVQVTGLTGTGDVTGSITGSYTASDGIIMTSSEVNATRLTINVMGQTIDGTDILNSILASAPINAAPYRCADGQLEIDFDTGSSRIPITLSPAG